MLRSVRYLFSVTEIPYLEESKEKLLGFRKGMNGRSFQLVGFNYRADVGLFGSYFSDNAYTPLLQLYFSFLQKKEHNPSNIAYNYIEQSLR